MTENGSDSLPFEPPEQENIRLREENARLRLRRLLTVHSIPIPQLAPEVPPPTKTVETAAPVDKEERARKRIALFRSLFRGREDVYARRWENDDGRHGYGGRPTRMPVEPNWRPNWQRCWKRIRRLLSGPSTRDSASPNPSSTRITQTCAGKLDCDTSTIGDTRPRHGEMRCGRRSGKSYAHFTPRASARQFRG